MNRGRVLLLIVLAAVLAPPLGLLIQQIAAPAAHAAPRGDDAYQRLLNIFIRNNWLIANPDGSPVVSLSQAARDTPEARAFLNGSPLKNDLEKNDPHLWRIENGVVIEMDPFAHYQPLPFAKRSVWRGNLLFRSDRETSARAEIVSSNGVYRLTARTASATPSAIGPSRGFDAMHGPLDGEGDTLELWSGEPSIEKPPLVRIVLAGETPLVRVTSAAGRVVLGGHRLASGETATFAPGEQLLLRDGRQTAVLTSRRTAKEAVSWSQPLADRYRAPGLDRFARDVESAMNQAVAQGFNPDQDVRLSLDGQLQARLQQALDAYCGEHGRFRAAVTVMDAQTGELLALASYPGDNGETTSVNGADLERNQNFYRLPIGSAAKVPVSAAILAEHPELATLQIHGGPTPITDLMGVHFEPVKGEGGGITGWINFNSYLKYSSDRYALALLLLGSSSAPKAANGLPTGADNYMLANLPISNLPTLPFPMSREEDGVELGPPEAKLDWPGRLHDLFGIDYEAPRQGARPDEFGDDSQDMTLWRGLLSDPSFGPRERPPILGGLRDASPDREVFAINRIESFRADYVPIILGGQNYGWTTIRLAQAFARIVTGLAVTPSILQRRGTEPMPGRLQALTPDLRKTLMDAMAQVTDAGGTAHPLTPGLDELKGLAPAGEQIGLWSKTGTPHLEIAFLRPSDKAENEAIQRKLLQLQDGRIVLVSRGKTYQPSNAAAAGALARDPLGRRILARYGVGARRILARAVRYNRDPGPGLYEIRNNLLVRVQGASGVYQARHDPKVYAFVVGRYAGAPGAGEPKRALAVAINIEERWLPDNESVVFARCILPTLLAPILYDSPSRARPFDGYCRSLGLS